MKKVKVRIYKDPNNNGKYINKTSKFLQKAQYGMQTGPTEQDVVDTILDELTMDPDADSIASKLQSTYGLSYIDAMDRIDEVVSMLYKQETKEMIPEAEVVEEGEDINKPKLYSINEAWVSEENEDDAEGWGDELAFTEDSLEDEETTEDTMKKGGSISKKKFVKNVVRGLKKAAAGMEQEESSTADIRDIPIGGRQAHINNFRRGVKDLGNEYYAKEIYDKTQQLQQQVRQLPPMAQDGMEMQQQDVENPMHHLEAYTGSVSNIFKEPMNQVHGAGYEMPQARKGREQRQADRQARQVDKDFQRAFGDIAAGYMGVPGLPNYVQVISPQVVQGQQGANQSMSGQTGPLIDINYKKGPWWSGKREWSAKGIPAQMLMGMTGGRGMMPGYGYMPSGMGYSSGSSWSTQRTFPGEIIRTKASSINAAADPAKNNESANLKNSGIKPYAGYMELNAAPPGTEMVYDAQGNEVEAISPEEAARRRAAATTQQYPWMVGAGNTDFIPTAPASSGSTSMAPIVTNEIPQTTGTASGAGIDRFNLELISSPTKPGTYYGKDATGVLYQFSGDISQHQVGKEPIARIAPGSPAYEEVMTSIYRKQYGGAAVNVGPDALGNLQRFVYGGGDDIEPIVAYDNNDINTKNTEDPFMFRNGGMFQYQGTQQSQVTPGTTTTPAAWKDLTEAEYKTKLEEEKKKWQEEQLKKQQQTQTQTRTQTQTQGGYYPQGYPTAPSPFEQIRDMFSPFKRNPQTGKNYDFMWASQQGPARTPDGQIWQPPAGQQQTTQRQTQQGTQGQGQTGTQGQPNPMQPGYYYDYKFEKGPFWKGNKKTMTISGKWIDPNNPNAGASASGTGTTATRQFNDGKGPTLDATAPKGPGASNFTQSADGKSAMSYDVKDPGAASSTTPNQPSAFPPGDPRGEYMKSQLTLPTPPAQPDVMPAGFPANTAGPRATEEDQMMYGGYMAYGGYVPEFQFAGQFNTSTGPFNPSGSPQVGGIGQGLTGPCTEAEVQDPNSPCYDPNYKSGSGTPQDFEVTYDMKKARTLNTKGIANTMGAVGAGIQGVSRTLDNIYQDDYLNSRTTADNREPINQLDFRGGYSGLNQRIMSKGQGAGSTGFNSVVGNAAFVKRGGQLGYQKGGEYDLTQEEIGRILAAGGQIEFI